ncbi:hypothetical protein [Rhodopirellula sp. MGV]|uniref:hypothetical protein n=1 Tax=Rhodopirellula sp. MGV TaxID=2023130 RepID=UPI00117AF065|nr:hypothetical protein [Rhodopirellula sp. MGV]
MLEHTRQQVASFHHRQTIATAYFDKCGSELACHWQRIPRHQTRVDRWAIGIVVHQPTFGASFAKDFEINIEITGETETLIQAVLAERASCGDANDSIRMLIREDQLTRASLPAALQDQAAALESLAVEGLESGDSIAMDSKFWEERRRLVNDGGPAE